MAAHRPANFPLGTFLDGADSTECYGIPVGGIPVGDNLYVQRYLATKAAKAVSKIDQITDVLRPLHLQSLHCAAYYGLNSLFEHRIQHCYPSDALVAARRVDAAVARTLDVCLGTDVMRDPFALERLRLPARMFGGGFRSSADVAPAAFLGALSRAIPRMLDRVGHQGIIVPGFLPQLAALLGAGSFDRDNAEVRFAALLRSDVRLANQLRDTWQGLRAEIGDSVEALPGSACGAGKGSANLQKDLTRLREKARFQRLDVAIRALPSDDFRRAAWTNVDAFSTTWVSAWPSSDCYVSNDEFAEIAARYFGMPSPACQGLLGQAIGT
eukprot:6871684-Karenia_brevis.AAC.1